MALEKFHWKLPIGVEKDDDGEERVKHYKVTLPHMDNISFGLIRKNRKLPQFEQFFALLEELCTEEDLEAMDKATQGAMRDMMEAWEKASNAGQGE